MMMMMGAGMEVSISIVKLELELFSKYWRKRVINLNMGLSARKPCENKENEKIHCLLHGLKDMVLYESKRMKIIQVKYKLLSLFLSLLVI